MAGITLDQAQANLQKWLDASAAASNALETQHETNRVKNHDPAQILKMIDYWQAKVNELTMVASGLGRRSAVVSPRY